MIMLRISFLTKMMYVIFIVIITYISIIRILYLNAKNELDVYFDISCYTEPGDELPYVDDKFKPKKQSIFFLETSCARGLNSRQACSIEAAARTHPLWDVHVFFVSRIKDLKNKSLVTLKKYSNVKFSRVDFEEYSKNTPLEKLVTTGVWLRTMWRVPVASDLLRYLTLYKFSGIYFDLDALLVKPLGDLAPNWVARESDWAVGAGAMAFSDDKVGRMMAENCIRDLAKNFRCDIWGNNGPGVIYRVLKKICKTENVTDMKAENCHGFKVYHQRQFYPIPWRAALQYFKAPTTTYPDTYAHHIWNHVTKDKSFDKGSLYDLLAKENCPHIYTAYGKDFGM